MASGESQANKKPVGPYLCETLRNSRIVECLHIVGKTIVMSRIYLDARHRVVYYIHTIIAGSRSSREPANRLYTSPRG